MVEPFNRHRPLAQSPDQIRPLHQLCREGRLYEVEHWITEGKPLQIALETGQHSLAGFLLSKGYRLELERYAPLDLALQARRLDLFDLLIERGAELKNTDVYTVLNSYNLGLYERFRAAPSSQPSPFDNARTSQPTNGRRSS